MDLSVLTIVRNRREHLENLLKGLALGQLVPTELVVVHMNEKAEPLPPADFKVKQVAFWKDHPTPLAAARNEAARLAGSDHLIFLDVDCIPDPLLVATYAKQLTNSNHLLSGKVRYLKPGANRVCFETEDWNSLSTPDPVRENIDQIPYELFWSLNFACSRDTYQQLGGFDERFVGYGAEDTDFAFESRRKGIALHTVAALAYHQYHDSYDPPVNHLQDILVNAKAFHEKWQVWPMRGWFRKFEQMGLLSWRNGQPVLERMPAAAELAACLKTA